MVLHHLTGRLPDEKGMASMGVHLLRAEAVAAIGQAFSSGSLPVEKTVTVIDKSREPSTWHGRAMGTPVGALLSDLRHQGQRSGQDHFRRPHDRQRHLQ
jgi:electron transport complex protein RnfC